MIDLIKVREAAHLLHDLGISFVLEEPSGYMRLGPEAVVRFIQDADAFMAKAAGVSKAHYQAYMKLHGDEDICFGVSLCAGKTKKGKPCGNWVNIPHTPAAWDGKPLFCRLHKGER